MSFLGRKKPEDDNQPMIDPNTGLPPPYTPPDTTGGKVKDEPKGNIFQRIGAYIVDSYNGLYKIVLEPSMPKRATVALIIFGMILGMISAYLIFPTEFTGASPRRMSDDAIEQWVKMSAVGFVPELGYGEQDVLDVLQQLPNPQQVTARLLNAPENEVPKREKDALLRVQAIPGFNELTGTVAPEADLARSISEIVIPLIAVIIIVPIVVLVWRLLIYDNIVAPIVNQFRRARDPELRAAQDKAKKDLETLQEQKRIKDEMAKNVVADAQYGEPIMQNISIYTKGRNYDDSFAIELGPEQGNQFLGECGASIATKVGDEVQSVEFWCFDMATQETLTKIFAAPAAVNDPTLQAKLAPRVKNPAMDIVPTQPGTKLILETDALRVQGEVATISYNNAGGTPNSGIENMQIKILSWQKQGSPAGIPTGGPPPIPPPQPLPDYSNMQFDPPPQMPASSPPPPAGGRPMDDYADIQFDPPPQMPASSPPPAGGRPMDDYADIQFDPPPQMPSNNPLQPPPLQMPPNDFTPLSPPPLQMPPSDEEDDPFGGTGDFTPLS